MFYSLIDVLRNRAQSQPEELAYIFLEDGEAEERRITYGALDRQARTIAAYLQSQHAPGSRALLLFPPGVDYVAAFLGCLYAGVIAVPAYPPRPRRPMPRIAAIVGDSQPSVALTDARILSTIGQRLAEMPAMAALDWIDATGLDVQMAQHWQQPSLQPNDLAYLQYTSGSTATPKGVMISHANLDHTLADLDAGWVGDERRTIVTWLPPFHDMGLVFGILLPLYAGFPCVMMAPVSFVQRPLRWLHALSRYRATHSAAPNFAYELCLEKIRPEERAALDLSAWRVAVNGAEPVRKDTLERFTAAFQESGFRWQAFSPGYGLAEATLQATGIIADNGVVDLTVDVAELERHRVVAPVPSDQPSARTLIGYPPSPLQTRWAIVDPERLTACPAGQVGEIWIASPGVASGYWNRPQATEETFHAYLAGSGEGPFLRTGDLGFIHDGNLYVTGRLKDLIIVRGRNHYPQDIELTAEQSHPAIEPGSAAAFRLDIDGEERAAMACELRREQRKTEPQEVIDAIRLAVVAEHELPLYAIVLTMPGQMPKTSSGKIQRQAARALYLAGELEVLGQWVEPAAHGPASANTDPIAAQPAGAASLPAIRDWLTARVAAHARLARTQIDVHEPFERYGLDSLAAVAITGELAAWLGRELAPTLFYEFPTVEAIARFLSGEPDSAHDSGLPPERAPAPGQEPIAIIGLGVRFPGADSPQAFWQLLCDGVDAIRETPPDRWDNRAFYDPNPAAPGKMNTRWGGYLDKIDAFDAAFFGISPREAARMDPQQRLLLEVAWEALEDAGQLPARLAGQQVGVFVGISSFDYGVLQLREAGVSDAYAGVGSALSIAANRLSYFFDWRGPSLAVDTACSSSLVAVHLACQNLRTGECDLALAAGVNLLLSPAMTVNFAKAGFMAPDGRCKPFDARADGYVRSEGAGVVLLKPLSRALADGDPVYAVILGSAVNQDGRSNGLTAPNPQAQVDLLRRAYRNAGIAPASVHYVEAHGTGTALGDPIEAQALATVLGVDRPAMQPASIGSVKSNIGHLEAAAGIAGLIKVALALRHGKLPPSLHFQTPNPLIPFDRLPLRVQQTLEEWPAAPSEAIAGVSAFGFGGANAHVVLKGAATPARPAPAPPTGAHALPLSAPDPQALHALAAAYRDFLSSASPEQWSDIAYTGGARRSHHSRRLAVVADTPQAAASSLDAFLAGRSARGLASGRERTNPHAPRLAFVFCGQGAHWWAMGRQLLSQAPVFRRTVEQCDALLRPMAGWSLLEELLASEAESRLDHTTYAQPALFAVQMALVALWRSWGVTPDAVVGHSMGEVAAAATAGVLELADALRIVWQRGRLMEGARGKGKMAAAEISPEEAGLAVAEAADRVGVAVVNSPTSVVLAGETAALQTLTDSLLGRGVRCQYLNLDFSSHNPQMDGYVAEMAAAVENVRWRKPSLPLVSTVTGQFAGDTPLDAAYWARNIREPVRFAEAMAVLLEAGYDTFLEIGPHPVLAPAIMQNMLHHGRKGTVTPSLRLNKDDRTVMLQSLATLYAGGREVNWGALATPGARLTALPAYPWQRERYWIEGEGTPGASAAASSHLPAPHPMAIDGKPARQRPGAAADLLYELDWQPQPLASNGATPSPAQSAARQQWLIFADRGGLGEAVATRLQQTGDSCTLVFSGEAFSRLATRRYTVNAARPDQFRQLLASVTGQDQAEWRGVVHLWSLDARSPESDDAALDEAQTVGCGSVLHLLQALAAGQPGLPAPLWLATRGVQPIGGKPTAQALAQSPVWGFGRAAALEHPELLGGLVDLDPQASPADVDNLLAAVRHSGADYQLAFRGSQAYVARLRHSAVKSPPQLAGRIRPDASYLITGGLGDLGIQTARWLADRGARHLVLLGRRALMDHGSWLSTPDTAPADGQAVAQAVRELERRGVTVTTVAADVGDAAQMAEVFGRLTAAPAPLRGIIHAAGVLEIRPLAEMKLEALHAVFRPKVAGSWVLQRLASPLDLDFFVLFSSLSSLLGWRHIGHYAAANHFLDTMAHYRSGGGLAAQSINWGPWDEIGMVSRSQGNEFARMGIAPLSVAQGLVQLESVLAAAPTQVAVIDANWERFESLYQLIRPSRVLNQLDHRPGVNGATPAGLGWLDRLKATPDSQRQPILVEFLRQRVAHVLRVGDDRISPELSIVELGLDSIMAMEVTWSCNEELKVPLLLRDVFEPPSLAALAADLADRLAGPLALQAGGNGLASGYASTHPPAADGSTRAVGRATERGRWTSLTPLRAEGTRPPLFLIPPGASTVLSFGSLVRSLDRQQPVYGLEPLGMDGRHPPQSRVEAMAAHYIDEIKLVQPDGPYLLAGRCFGGLVAFEMAQQLQARGDHVALLAILDTLRPPKPPWLRDQEASGPAQSPLRRTARRWLGRLYLLWKRLTVTGAFTVYTLKQMRPEERFPNVLSAEAANIRHTARAHYEANELYLPRLYEGRLTLFANAGHTGKHQLNWAALTSQAVDIQVVPGNHLTMFKEPYVRVLADVLANAMHQALQRNETPVQRRRLRLPAPTASRRSDPHRPPVVQVSAADTKGATPDDGISQEIAQACTAILGQSLAGSDHLPPLATPPFVDVYLQAELEERTHKPWALATLLGSPTIDQLAGLARRGTASNGLQTALPLQAHGSRTPLFLIPDIYGTAASLAELAGLLDGEQPCYGFQPSGLAPGQTPHASVEEMAACYIRDMRQIQPAGPYQLGGVGFGGIVAFEMAQQLLAADQQVGLLAVLDTMIPPNATLHMWNAPSSVQPDGSRPDWLVHRAAGRLMYWWQQRQFHTVIPRQAQRSAGRRVRAPHQHAATRRIQATLSAHFQARVRYLPRVYPGWITLFANANRSGARQVKWAMLTDAGMEIEVIPGDHETMFRQPYLAELADRLSSHLDEAQRIGPRSEP